MFWFKMPRKSIMNSWDAPLYACTYTRKTDVKKQINLLKINIYIQSVSNIFVQNRFCEKSSFFKLLWSFGSLINMTEQPTIISHTRYYIKGNFSKEYLRMKILKFQISWVV